MNIYLLSVFGVMAFSSLSLFGGNHSTFYGYDSLNRIKFVQLPNGSRIEYTYNAAGNRIASLAAGPGAITSETVAVESGGSPNISISNPGGPGASYEWYRAGIKFDTTSVPALSLGASSPQHAGAYRVIIRETNGSVAVVDLMVKLTGLTYESWLRHKESSTATPADLGLGKLSSANSDGIENILKYAFGRGPRESAHDILPRITWTGEGPSKKPSIRFQRIFDPRDIALRAEASGDLETWHDVTEELTMIGDPVVSPDGLSEQVILQYPEIPSQPIPSNRMFLRIVVEDTNDSGAVILSDDFDDGAIDPVKWNVSGNTVLEEDGYLKIFTNATDAGGSAYSHDFPMPANGITITRRARVQYGNNRSIPSLALAFRGQQSASDGWVFSILYGNMGYNSGNYIPVYGTFLGLGQGYPHYANQRHLTVEGPAVLWDTWFDEKITYERATGRVRYFRNGVEEITGVAPVIDAEAPVFLNMNSWGWWTGHWHYSDDLLIRSGVAE